MNIVTKSGTNDFHGSWFTSMRNTSLNAKTLTEKLNNIAKGEYERYQYGGSFGGPIMQNKAHFFAAYERTQQDTTQSVEHAGAVPGPGRRVPHAEPREPVHGEGFGQSHAVAVPFGPLRPQHQLAGLRRDDARACQTTGATVDQQFNSINMNHNWVLGGSKLNEFVFQYADFGNHVDARAPARRRKPSRTASSSATTATRRRRPSSTSSSSRDDFSWHKTGMGGLGHDFKAGVNFINEPHLYVTFASGSSTTPTRT